MLNLSTEGVAEKIKQLLTAGVSLEEITKKALSQGVEKETLSNAIRLAQGQEIILETEKKNLSDVERTVKWCKNKKCWAILLGLLALSIMFFSFYVFFERSKKIETINQTILSTKIKNNQLIDQEGRGLDEAILDIEAVLSSSKLDSKSVMKEIDAELNLSGVVIIKDVGNSGSQPLSEEEDLSSNNELLSEIEIRTFKINGFPEFIKKGVVFDFMVMAIDTDGRTIQSYQNDIEIFSNTKNARFSKNTKFTISDKGAKLFKGVFGHSGQYNLIVKDRSGLGIPARVRITVE